MSERNYDPELAPIIPMLPTVSDFGDISAMREQLEEMIASFAPPVADDPAVETEDRTVPGPDGAPDVGVRIFRPKGSAARRPGVLYIHGGGFIVGSIQTEHSGTSATAA